MGVVIGAPSGEQGPAGPTGPAGVDGTALAKVSSNDSTAQHLEDKLVKSSGLIKTVLSEGANERVEFRLGDHYLSLASSGVYEGGVLSAGVTTGTFNIAEGSGLWIDSATDFQLVKDNVQGVEIAARTNIPITNILTQPVTYILVDKDDSIQQFSNFPTPTERRQYIFLGVVVHSDNVTVNTVNNLPSVALDISAQVQDIMQGLGFFNLSGNIVIPNGSNLKLSKTSGTAFKAGANFSTSPEDPHSVILGAQGPVTFRYRNQDSSEGSDITDLDPLTYDLNGTTTGVPGGGGDKKATIQRVYIFPSGAIRIQRGQEVFGDVSKAVNAIGHEAFTTEENIEENGLLLASIVLRRNTTDVSDEAKAIIFKASRFGEVGSVGSSATTNLQQATDNSIDPEITLASGVAVSMKSATDSTQVVQDWKDDGDVVQATMKGNGILQFTGYTVAGVPAASSNAGGTTYITNEVGGATLAWSDGTNWKRYSDGANISS